ncbi:MAG: hypothetical protein J6W75_02280 [Bacteroidaceae bacterium]|nr:hypothetical protein [Bacteroidaceae bacterium]
MNKTDQILERLKGQQPVIDDPDVLTERIMSSLPELTTEQPKPARQIRLYIVSAIAAAASVLLLLTLHYVEKPTSVEAVADLRQEVSTSVEAVADLRQEVSTSVEAVADSRQGAPTSVSKANHSIDCGQSSNRPRSTEESITLDEPIEYARQANRVQQAEPLTEVLTERDIPITRPENYKYTPEEIALMKKQALEAYLKWVELELEIAKYNQEQTANNYRDL